MVLEEHKYGCLDWETNVSERECVVHITLQEMKNLDKKRQLVKAPVEGTIPVRERGLPTLCCTNRTV
ncbi:uncharacterized protein ZHAS_00009874 [Anopheles sinensis]|uniref:Uncharacterized protein n=1 Tax=Anopheles sinensis TaxID=74873 RepID=A0A084VW39_ANOSI|nr:uncharacterized protein ZHAS_00009874 [Anopheles sinensis]